MAAHDVRMCPQVSTVRNTAQFSAPQNGVLAGSNTNGGGGVLGGANTNGGGTNSNNGGGSNSGNNNGNDNSNDGQRSRTLDSRGGYVYGNR